VGVFTSLDTDQLAIKKCRFIYAVFIAFVIIPYMLGLNISGSHVFKSEYFEKVQHNRGNMSSLMGGQDTNFEKYG
jgi:hypothetical protein